MGIVLSGSMEKDGSGERMLVFVGEEESISRVSSAESVGSGSVSIVRVPVAKAKGLEVLEDGRSELCQFIWIMGAMRVIVGSAGRARELDLRSVPSQVTLGRAVDVAMRVQVCPLILAQPYPLGESVSVR